jgi:hypothetical protein
MRATCAENKADKDFMRRTRQKARFKCRGKGLWAVDKADNDDYVRRKRLITSVMYRGQGR